MGFTLALSPNNPSNPNNPNPNNPNNPTNPKSPNSPRPGGLLAKLKVPKLGSPKRLRVFRLRGFWVASWSLKGFCCMGP